jgi:hypothetical protein
MIGFSPKAVHRCPGRASIPMPFTPCLSVETLRYPIDFPSTVFLFSFIVSSYVQ